MAPKTGKREMTQEQLDKLAAARQKANAVKQAMKEGKEEEMISILQAKIDKIKMKSTKAKPKELPETNECVPEEVKDNEATDEQKSEPPKEMPKEMPEDTPKDTPKDIPKEINVPDTKAQISEPTMYGNLSPPYHREKKSKKKSSKPLVLVHESESSDDSEQNENVIYIRKPRKKKQITKEEQQPPQVPHVNPFFSYNPMLYRNFQ